METGLLGGSIFRLRSLLLLLNLKILYRLNLMGKDDGILQRMVRIGR